MQRLKLLPAIIFSACLLYACSGNNAATAEKANAVNENKSGDASSPSASFSVTIDDTVVSGNGTDDMQLSNAAFIYPPKDENTKRLFFTLVSNNKENALHYSCTFNIPYKTGEFIKKLGDGQPYDIAIDRQGGDFSRYIAQAVTVNISSLTATRVTGTFSGELELSGDTPRGNKKSISLTNGKFDIPFSTGTVRPM